MSGKLIWIDLEMTGLDPGRDFILEIATLVTDDALELVAKGFYIAIKQSEEILCSMSEWAMTHHKKSGLLDRVMASSHDCRSAEKETLEFLCIHSKKGDSPLCGNSVLMDRQFLRNYMPRLEDFFHYRNIDVSTIKELARRWYPSLSVYRKEKTHRALSDIRESINELRYYRRKIFLP